MQEMRITPELPGYAELVQNIFLELIDGHLTTPEEMRAYLEPHSPPAPPPQVTIKRSRAKRAEAKIKEQAFDEDEEDEDVSLTDDDLEAIGDDERNRSERSAQGCSLATEETRTNPTKKKRNCAARRRVRLRLERRSCPGDTGKKGSGKAEKPGCGSEARASRKPWHR